MYCIYRVTNNVNGKTYIGQHKYVDDANPIGKYWGSGLLINKAYKKYGKENFTIEVLYKRIQYKETADSMEIWAIEKERKENVNGCYNIANGGGGLSHTNYPEELRQKLREVHKGQVAWNKGKKGCFSEETRKKMSEAAKKRENRPQMTEEQKEKLRSLRKGMKLSDEWRKKLSESHKGQKAWNKNKKIGHWYNNGVKCVMASECPEGFVPGRLSLRRNKDDNQ